VPNVQITAALTETLTSTQIAAVHALRGMAPSMRDDDYPGGGVVDDAVALIEDLAVRLHAAEQAIADALTAERRRIIAELFAATAVKEQRDA
jgi:hypothetical protein